MNLEFIYEKFKRKIASEDELRRHEYPMPDPLDRTKREARDANGQALTLQRSFASSYECHRCGVQYQVDGEGKSQSWNGICYFHHRNHKPVNIGYGVMGHHCCKKLAGSVGCSKNQYHVHTDQPLIQNYSGYVETQPKANWRPSQHGVYALDCEMCFTVHGQQLVEVAVVDHEFKVVYKKLVKPASLVLDYFPLYTGITESDLKDVTTTLADVQRDLLELFSSETILVGHSLYNDLKALKLFHMRVVDTSIVYPHPRGLPYKMSLRMLAERRLGLKLAEAGDANGHDVSEDAIVAMRLAKLKCL